PTCCETRSSVRCATSSPITSAGTSAACAIWVSSSAGSRVGAMALHPPPLEGTLITERELWLDGPPHELFGELRRGCPVHWTERISEYPGEAGYWSGTTADHVHEVSRDWQTYSSERGGVTALTDAIFPLDLQRAMFIAMD